MIDFKQNPFKMKIKPLSNGENRAGRSCLRARLVFRWKTWVQNSPLTHQKYTTTIYKNFNLTEN